MNDSAYIKAGEREGFLLSEIEKAKLNLLLMEKELQSVRAFQKMWRVFAGVDERASDEPVTPSNLGIKSSSRSVNSKKEEVAEAARRIIEARGEPVSRSDLYAELTDRGFTITGTDPEMVLSTMLWRMRDRVVRLPKGGYWLPEIDAPQFGWDLKAKKIGDEFLDDIFGSKP